MTLISTKNALVTGKNGRRIQLIAGKALTQAQVNNLTARHIRDYTEKKQSATKRVPYTYEEAVDLAGCYVTMKGDLTSTVASFITLNPGQNHTADSVKCAAYQLRAIDPNCPNYNKWVAKTTIIAAALETQEKYFDPTGDITDAYYLAA